MNSQQPDCKDTNSEKELLNKFLRCHSCSKKSVPIEFTSYSLPYELLKVEVYVCEDCRTAFALNYLDNKRVEKETISIGALYHQVEIPF